MAEKRFMVVPRTERIKKRGFDIGRGKRSFNKRGALFVSTEAEANDIDKTLGMKGSNDVWVHEDPHYEWHLKHEGSDGMNREIHHYTWGPTRRYAEAWEAFEKRRKDK